jgi:DNA-binding MarR family transcriptional regulator
MSHRFHCTRQNISQILNSLERMGCVERIRGAASALASAADAQGDPPSVPPLPRFDRRIVLLRLTKHGEDLIRYVFPKHAKVVKAEMRVLDGREQESLSRMCVKLREGDAVKFLKELMFLRGPTRDD